MCFWHLTGNGFDLFFRERFARTVVLLIAMGASRADAEDAAQEAMVLAWRQWDSVHEPSAWVRTANARPNNTPDPASFRARAGQASQVS